MAIGRSMEGNHSFLWQKIQIYELRECRLIDYMKLRMKNHYDAVLNQAPSDNLVKKFVIRLR